MAYTVPGVTVNQEFQAAQAFAELPLAALIVGPHFKLFRYSESAEKALTKVDHSDGESGNNYINNNTGTATATDYYGADEAVYEYPNRPDNSTIDQDYVKVYFENVEALYFPHVDLSSVDGTDNKAVALYVDGSTSVFHKNRIKGIDTNIRFKTTDAGDRSSYFSNRDVQVGDIIEIIGSGITAGDTGSSTLPFKTKVRKLIASEVDPVNGTNDAWTDYADGITTPKIDRGIAHITVTGTTMVAGTYDVVISAPDHPGGRQATAVATITGVAAGTVEVTDPGSGYSTVPTCTITSGDAALVADFYFEYDSDDDGTAEVDTAAVAEGTLSITSAATDFVGTSDITYKVTCVRSGPWYDGSNSDVCARLQITSDGNDSSAALVNAEVDTAFDVGTLGVQATIATVANVTGLNLNDTWYVPVTAATDGDVNIIELNDELPASLLTAINTVDGTTTLTFKLKLAKSSVEIAELRSLVGSQLNFTVGEDNITLETDISTTDSSLVDGSDEVISLPINAAKVYVEYRALLQDTAVSISNLSDATEVQDTLGTIHPDNHLAQGVYDALLNSANTTVYYVGVATDDLDGYSDALNLAKYTDKVYSIVPLTFDTDIQQAVVAHINTMSAATLGKERTAWLSSQVAATEIILDTKSDGTDYTATVVDDPLDASAKATLVTISGATLITDEIREGDSLLINFQLDATGEVVYEAYAIEEVRSETSVVIATGFDTPITSAIKVQIRRNYTKAEQVANLAAAGSGYDNRRVVTIFPDTYYNGTTLKSGYFMAAALAGLASGVAPHQGLTNVEILGATDVSRTFVTFTSTDMDTLAEAGYWIVTQEAVGSTPYTRHQLTTDASDLNMKENSVTRNVDSIAKGLRTAVAPYIGKYNINPTNLLLFRGVIDNKLRYYKTGTYTTSAGNQLIDYTIVSVEQSTTFRDKVEVVVNLTLPYPNNNTEITLVI